MAFTAIGLRMNRKNGTACSLARNSCTGRCTGSKPQACRGKNKEQQQSFLTHTILQLRNVVEKYPSLIEQRYSHPGRLICYPL